MGPASCRKAGLAPQIKEHAPAESQLSCDGQIPGTPVQLQAVQQPAAKTETELLLLKMPKASEVTLQDI